MRIEDENLGKFIWAHLVECLSLTAYTGSGYMYNVELEKIEFVANIRKERLNLINSLSQVLLEL